MGPGGDGLGGPNGDNPGGVAVAAGGGRGGPGAGGPGGGRGGMMAGGGPGRRLRRTRRPRWRIRRWTRRIRRPWRTRTRHEPARRGCIRQCAPRSPHAIQRQPRLHPRQFRLGRPNLFAYRQPDRQASLRQRARHHDVRWPPQDSAPPQRPARHLHVQLPVDAQPQRRHPDQHHAFRPRAYGRLLPIVRARAVTIYDPLSGNQFPGT